MHGPAELVRVQRACYARRERKRKQKRTDAGLLGGYKLSSGKELLVKRNKAPSLTING